MVNGKFSSSPSPPYPYLSIELKQKASLETARRKGGKVDFDQVERDETLEKVRLETDMLQMV